MRSWGGSPEWSDRPNTTNSSKATHVSICPWRVHLRTCTEFIHQDRASLSNLVFWFLLWKDVTFNPGGKTKWHYRILSLESVWIFFLILFNLLKCFFFLKFLIGFYKIQIYLEDTHFYTCCPRCRALGRHLALIRSQWTQPGMTWC